MGRLVEIDEESDVQQTVKKAKYEDEERMEDKKGDYMERTTETLTENTHPVLDNKQTQNSSESEFSDCEVCHQSIRKSVYEFHKKTHLSSQPKMSECKHCKKVMQKTSMWRHLKSRCTILNMNTSTDSHERPEVSSPVKPEQPAPATNYQCKICFCNFPKLASLKWHTTEEHSLDLEDVEQMLSESNNQADFVKKSEQRMDNRASVKLDPEILEKVMNNTTDAANETKKEEENFKCKYCDDVFTKRNNARRHEKRRHPEFVSRH